ncbi:MAG TPA: HU family DNA-binding protein [Bryobacteraceae bacterium]|nr:HU family DNA-binding protein [Bryobacteraceae bacterium]
MKRKQLARALAERNRLTHGEAQDQLDRLVHKIVRSLRQGRAAKMPGIGRLTPKPPAPASSRRAAAVPCGSQAR